MTWNNGGQGMRLEGIKANFLGDSITAGAGVADLKDVYWNLLKRECGLAEARGYGIGGTRIAIQNYPEHPDWDQDFLSRIDSMDADADLIVVFGGTNDFGHGDAPLGSLADRSPYTFYGAIHMLIQRLMVRYPEAELVLLTPLHRLVEEKGERKLKDYVIAIKEVAEYYGVPVCDMYATCPIQPQFVCNGERLAPDGLHPNEAGHQRIYKRLRGFLEVL